MYTAALGRRPQRLGNGRRRLPQGEHRLRVVELLELRLKRPDLVFLLRRERLEPRRARVQFGRKRLPVHGLGALNASGERPHHRLDLAVERRLERRPLRRAQRVQRPALARAGVLLFYVRKLRAVLLEEPRKGRRPRRIGVLIKARPETLGGAQSFPRRARDAIVVCGGQFHINTVCVLNNTDKARLLFHLVFFCDVERLKKSDALSGTRSENNQAATLRMRRASRIGEIVLLYGACSLLRSAAFPQNVVLALGYLYFGLWLLLTLEWALMMRPLRPKEE